MRGAKEFIRTTKNIVLLLEMIVRRVHFHPSWSGRMGQRLSAKQRLPSLLSVVFLGVSSRFVLSPLMHPVIGKGRAETVDSHGTTIPLKFFFATPFHFLKAF
ncbi:Uncharacterized protein TCM_029486 [Theobroma cacao]|uniref:Uncharacterized protein n=1 Tax=Theobroma cacao TaxID=3641 RepID=A0A061GKW5_THECC|nr:Uncharacterized protein TCM_029486 [Theobroma cacao]